MGEPVLLVYVREACTLEKRGERHPFWALQGWLFAFLKRAYSIHIQHRGADALMWEKLGFLSKCKYIVCGVLIAVWEQLICLGYSWKWLIVPFGKGIKDCLCVYCVPSNIILRLNWNGIPLIRVRWSNYNFNSFLPDGFVRTPEGFFFFNKP